MECSPCSPRFSPVILYGAQSVAIISALGTILGIIALLGAYHVIGVGLFPEININVAWGLSIGSFATFLVFALFSVLSCSLKRKKHITIEIDAVPQCSIRREEPRIVEEPPPIVVPVPQRNSPPVSLPVSPSSSEEEEPTVVERVEVEVREGIEEPEAVEELQLIAVEDVDRMIINYENIPRANIAQANEGFLKRMMQALLCMHDYFPWQREQISYGAELELLFDLTILMIALEDTITEEGTEFGNDVRKIKGDFDTLKVPRDYLIFRLAKDRYAN